MAKIKLGINNGFAIKRWAEPEEWIKIIKNELGLNIVQFSFDLLDPNTTEPARTIQASAIKEMAQKNDIIIQSASTGYVAYAMNFLLHPDFGMRLSAVEYLKNAINLSAMLSVESMGGFFGAFSMKEYTIKERKKYLIGELREALHLLGKMAKSKGLGYLFWETQPIPRELPAKIDDVLSLYDSFNEEAPLPIKFLYDVGHSCNYEASGPDLDPYHWIKRIGKLCPIIHLQQTDGKGDRHWPFTKEFNEMGIIKGDKIIDAVNESGIDEVYLELEIVHAFEEKESKVIDDLKESAEYWLKAISK